MLQSWFAFGFVAVLPIYFYAIVINAKQMKILILLNCIITTIVIISQLSPKFLQFQVVSDKMMANKITNQKNDIKEKYNDYEKIVSLKPSSGSGILAINDYIGGVKTLSKPLLTVTHRTMIRISTTNVFNAFYKQVLTDGVFDFYTNRLQAGKEKGLFDCKF